MTVPTATYRLQFRNGMTFDKACALVPHIKALGVSHLYASPIFRATTGSTHGYDVVDPNEVDPALGGREGFDRLAETLRKAGLGLILDIVPNHLGASLENPWWRSVIELGRDSPHADVFDIDWSRRLTLPVIARLLEDEIAEGNVSLVRHDGVPVIECYGNRYPLHPSTHDFVRLDGGAEHLLEVIARQPWQFIPWQEAASNLSYRRFFEITGLVGVRVEDPRVFEETHRTVLEMVRSGQVDGLRIDHIDGLADPEAYLTNLREAAGPDCYIVVEKILERGEQLPDAWPVSGTTGYEFISSLADVLVDHAYGKLDLAYAEAAPEMAETKAALRAAKELMVDRNFRGEVTQLQAMVRDIAATEPRATGLAPEVLDAALREVLIAFPVYRTYGSARGLHGSDVAVLDRVFNGLMEHPDEALCAAFRFLRSTLKGDVGVANATAAKTFRTRLQHLTGPLLAKSLEDTFFYRYNRLIALNEVGGDPTARDGSVEGFHAAMKLRLRKQPEALSTTSTHDTKRGEDARARLYAISEMPREWVEAVTRWRQMNAANISELADGPAPEPNVEWLVYQALAGVWPPDLAPDDRAGLKALEERFLPYVEKALREAKLRTDWAETSVEYEQAVQAYASRLLSADNDEFLADFHRTIAPLVGAGLVNSLSQTLIKLASPGIPDIYQGCEGLDFSLVDPDNRRIPDFASFGPDGPGGAKYRLIASALDLRAREPDLFALGDYLPLKADGPMAEHIVAFARKREEKIVIAVAPRLMLKHLEDGRIPPSVWRGTRLVLPDGLGARPLADVLGGGKVTSSAGGLALETMLAERPVALLFTD